MGENLEGVTVRPLKQIRDHRGAVFHMIRRDSPEFEDFGEVYFSFVNEGVIKGWKRHRVIKQHFAVPVGRIQLVIYDDRTGSATFGRTQVLTLGPEEYSLVRIPPMVWYAFRGLGPNVSMVVNCTNQPFEPGESEQIPVDSPAIPFHW